jgi:outer membrane protein
MRLLIFLLACCTTLGTMPARLDAQVPAAAQQAPTPAAAQATPFPEGWKIAYMNPQRVVATSAAGKALAARMEAFRAQKLAELNVKGKDIEAAQQKLASGALLSADSRAAIQKNLDRLQVELQRAQQDAETALQELQQKLNDEFEPVLARVVEKIVREKGLYLLIRLDPGVILWADPALDLTDEVVRRLDTAK